VDTRSCNGVTRCFYDLTGVDGKHGVYTALYNSQSPSCEAVFLPRNNNGCFEEQTTIRMADGSDRPIYALRPGDRVLNPITGKAVGIRKLTAGPESLDLVVVGMRSTQVKVTTEHPMMTRTGVKQAIALTTADELRGADGKWQRVTKISREATKKNVYNFEIDTPSSAPDEHAVLADGVVTGDLYIQSQLKAKITATPEAEQQTKRRARVEGSSSQL